MKGWIALDIDGTITQDKYSVPEEVTHFLRKQTLMGWKIAFATGRAFVFAYPALKNFDFSFVLLPQNGSIALTMPEKRILFRSYLRAEKISLLEKAVEGTGTDLLIYAGYEHHDRCYFRPTRLSKEWLVYLDGVRKRENETWYPVENFGGLGDVPLIKCFGSLPLMKKVAFSVKQAGGFEVALIRDPFVPGIFILLITDEHTSKGASLEKVFQSEGRGGVVIAAGDDDNDKSLLEVADIKIAMPHAPERLRKTADFIAPPVEENGIVQALKIVIENVPT